MDIDLILRKQRAVFASGQTRPLSARLERLMKLQRVFIANEQAILQALKQDLNKSEFEAFLTEIGFVRKELSHAIKHLKKWAKPRRVPTPAALFGSKSFILPEPYGATLVMAPWNFPVQLSLVPLIGAVCAGNTVILKPSELAPAVSQLLVELIAEAFDPDWAIVIEGGADVGIELLEQKFDFLFFTGSVPVGKIVMAAAAKHLTPVALELGGKSPCIVHNDANLKLAAKRIAFGKFTNAGQTCVAPDYLLVHREVKALFTEELGHAISELYGPDPLQNMNYGRLINERHFRRVSRFLQEGVCLFGGQTDAGQLKIAPTVLDAVSVDSEVMQEEIFGPVLPMLEYEDIPEVIRFVNARPKPLAFYLFTESNRVQQHVLERISFGGGCINDTIIHFASPYLPIGGVGDSGNGNYHGRSSFETFSHKKSVLRQTTLFDLPFRYPTSKWGLKVMRMLMK